MSVVVAYGLLIASVAYAAEEDVTYETSAFAITYSTNPADPDAPSLSDENRSGIPDQIETLGQAMEMARAKLSGLGFDVHPSSERYEVYVARAGGGAVVRAAPDAEGPGGDSYMVVPPSQLARSLPELEALALHEYFHAVQFRVRFVLPQWFMEGSATWISEEMSDGPTGDFASARSLLLDPRGSLLSASGPRAYGAHLFFAFLHERYAPEEPGEPLLGLLTALADGEVTVARALERWLTERGVTSTEMWGEFLLRARQLKRFEEGPALRSLMQGTPWPTFLWKTKVAAETCRRNSNLGSRLLEPLSGDFVRLRPVRSADAVGSVATLRISGPSEMTGYVMLKMRGASPEVYPFDGAQGPVEMTLPFRRPNARHVTLALGNGALTGIGITISYSLVVDGSDTTEMTRISGPGTIQYGLASQLSGHVICAEMPSPGSSVLLEKREGDEVSFEELLTGPDGAWRTTVSPEKNARYFAHLTDPFLSDAGSVTDAVNVAPFVTIETPRRVRNGEEVSVRGTVSPDHDSVVRIEYRRPLGARWRQGPETAIVSGGYAASFVLPGEGVWELRTRMLSTGDADHVPGVSLVTPLRVLR